MTVFTTRNTLTLRVSCNMQNFTLQINSDTVRCR